MLVYSEFATDQVRHISIPCNKRPLSSYPTTSWAWTATTSTLFSAFTPFVVIHLSHSRTKLDELLAGVERHIDNGRCGLFCSGPNTSIR